MADDGDGLCVAMGKPVVGACCRISDEPFGIVVSDVLGQGPSDVLLANRHQPVETVLLDRPHDTVGMRIRMRGPGGRLP